MKTVEQLEKLSKNPFYEMNEEEKKVLEESKTITIVSSKSVDNKKKESSTALGSASVKEIGKLDKHHGDPVSE